MGQKQAKKNDYDHKNEKARKNEETSYPTTVVLKIDMHCDECASKVIKCLHAFGGVECVKPEIRTESVDPIKPKDKLSGKTKKNVDIVSPLPNKDKENKPKNNEKKTKDKEAPVTTTVLKVFNLCPCQGCSHRIRRAVLKFKGVKEVSTDREKGMVMVKGTMDVTALVQKLSEKFRRKVEVVPAKKEKEKEKGKEKEKDKEKVKEKEKEKKKKENETEKEGDKGGSGSTKKKKKGGNEGDNDKDNEGDGKGQAKTGKNDSNYMVPACGYGYGEYYYYVGQYYPASEMFSDENPHACHIM
ncbi:heavy metal-associated isoprenylated plant protein 3-like [Vigna radiata var. radiata]|uniref:Heavy metal-associated isoprenylated plant protein 3-like n=1 Tax=Vigna radiata var. radiata TaxID=3916 RepID=A0A3Q0EZS1_VIGRR|nr:heavy metal-associated isoprenylated plant protein 3-like [Vigna radiata var. radiata]